MYTPCGAVLCCAVLMEVETDSLTEEVFKVGEFAGTVGLLIESQVRGVAGSGRGEGGAANVRYGVWTRRVKGRLAGGGRQALDKC